VPSDKVFLRFRLPGYKAAGKRIPPHENFTTIFLSPTRTPDERKAGGPVAGIPGASSSGRFPIAVNAPHNESYEHITENPFEPAARFPFSSFTLNADDASYCNVRRFITRGVLPPVEAVRIEEMINYLPYQSIMDSVLHQAMSFQPEVTTCPWEPSHWLMRVAVEAKKLAVDTALPNNLVLLVDISGSMDAPNKLPLLKKAFGVLVKQLDASDRVAVIVYSGNATMVLPPTPGNQKRKIMGVIGNLYAGGSTAGKAGIEMAFKLAKANFRERGNNRVIMATDGDFNVGQSSDDAMRQLIIRYHDWGIYLTCIGVGIGNYKDSKLETLAKWGQGNFIYLDDEAEAERVFSREEFDKILVTCVRNASLKAILNPEIVKSYRLIGYESRPYGKTDSLQSNPPGGELGFGQHITAFYELDPARKTAPDPSAVMATIALQYQKASDGSRHLLVRRVPAHVIPFSKAGQHLQFAAGVALFGMLLRHSGYTGKGNFVMVKKMVARLKGRPYRQEHKAFLKLVQKTVRLLPKSGALTGAR
jgi:Ca-activated chloride channel family protein